ncbi:hypothetical protein IW150_004212 [Coemansia sp. RSA 2607]|nr:hypothetical protein IW150_004212 [Coemansia sp. RSA 2607]
MAHPLTLKVMRLSRPTLAEAVTQPLAGDQRAVFAPAVRDMVQNGPAQAGTMLGDSSSGESGDVALLGLLPLSETLELPRAVGAMYLGETFAAHVCVCNESTATVRDVAVQVAMQTQAQTQAQAQAPPLVLADTAGQPRVLAGGQPLNLQVAHEVKELGTHVLTCGVAYTTAQGERRVLQRAFKFQAANPLVVKTKVNHLARDVLLEVQVHNAAAHAMALERLRFDAAAPFALAADLNAAAALLPGYMLPGDVRQYLYRLRPQHAAGAPQDPEHVRALHYAAALGKLDIVWRGPFGSVGRLQTSQLVRRPPGMFLLDVEHVHAVADRVVVEQPFAVRVRVRNLSEAAMDVVASSAAAAHAHPAVVACGPAQHVLGRLDVGATAEFDLELLPLAPGVHRVGAVALADAVSGYTREIDHLLDVHVHAS